MQVWLAIAHIAGWLTLSATIAAVLIGAGIWLRWQLLIFAGGAVVAFTVGLGMGVYQEKVVCDARFEVARAEFKKLEAAAAKTSKETADKLSAQLSEKDKRIDELVDKYENLDATKAAACRITADDLRRGMR